MNRKGSLFFHFSNEVDTLFECFSNKVKGCSPFDSKYVVVPSLAVKKSLKKKITDSLGICMGINFCSMQPIIHKMIGLLFPEIRIESHLDLALKIELTIKEMAFDGRIKSPKFAPLCSYLMSGGAIDSLKLTALSDHLASLFVTYALYCRDLKGAWQSDLKEHWQKELWELIFEEKDYYYNPYQVLSRELQPVEDLPTLFIFNASFLPRPYFQFLKHISQKVQVEFFQLSMCSYFWSDIHTDFEKSVYLSRMKKKQVSDQELGDLEGYLSNTNALLANYGKLGREWIKIIEEEQHLQSEEIYFAPEEILKIPSYEKWVHPSDIHFNQDTFTCLGALKTDLLLMHSKGEPLSLCNDGSIQIHQASTYQREVEILYGNLIELFEENSHLKPSDVTVYIPKIENYIPYLQELFKDQENGIEISIFNAPFMVHNSPLKAFYLLIDLASNRWDADKILELFHHPAFKTRFGITHDMLKEWQSWIEEVGVSFGYNEKDQKRELTSQYLDMAVVDESPPSFEALIQSLLKFLCQKHETYETIKNLSSLDFSDSDSINLLIELLNSLRQDLLVIKENEMSLGAWASYLECLYESYFSFDQKEQPLSQKILSRIASYRSHFSSKSEELFTFQTMYYYLKKELGDLEGGEHSSKLHGISFYSLANSPAIDSKVIYIMGLNDLEFPRPKVENPLCIMENFSSKDYRPLSMEYDRYLFLEMIVSAKERLFLSYLGYSTETFKEVGPSILISELLSYLDKRLIIDGAKPSDVLTYNHPHLSFNNQNFKNENFHSKSYSLAKSYYHSKPFLKTGIIHDFLEGKKSEDALEAPLVNRAISIHHLTQLARDSIQFTLNRSHQIFLEKESISHSNQNFSISSLQKALLKKRLLKNQTMPMQEGFPKGIFKEIALDTLEKECHDIQDFLNENDLKLEDFFSVEFREDVAEAKKISGTHWVLPSIKIESASLGRVEVIGLLEDISCKGLLSFRSLDEGSLFLEWPRYLMYSLLPKLLPMEFEPSWLFSKSKKIKSYVIDDPMQLLEQYLQFYSLSQSYILPFLPAWIPYFMKYKPGEILKRMKQDLDSPYFYNKYTKTMMGCEMPKASTIELWQNMGKQLFEKTYSIISQ